MIRRILAGFVCLLGGLSALQAQRMDSGVREQGTKFQRLITYVDLFYTDTVNVQQLTESAIVKVLSDLDPHSVYISREEVAEMNEPLEGGFFGIGIQFSIFQDTLMVVSVVPGGPSEKVGLLAGDRIVQVDGQNIAGVKLSNTEVRKRLKGEKGTLVKVSVVRGREVMGFHIIRDKIPLHSVDAAYMLDNTTGYLKISRFADNTVEEFEAAVRKMQQAGMKDLVLDLQGNVGGYMGAAIGIGDHFLGDRKMIVYTEGRASALRQEYATAKGLLETGRLAVLMDGNSASASEIVAGAVQDWDRGLIVGRRSFGKGLVQREFPLPDNSRIRLTIAHYYTPSGRGIQKPYKGENYRAELYDRYASGELLSADSIVVNDSLKYFTKLKNRVVYGGGGIVPDLFVPIDTSVNYQYFNRLIGKNVIGEYVVGYIDKNREQLRKRYPSFEKFRQEFAITDGMLEEVVKAGERAGVPRDEKLFRPVAPSIKMMLKAYMARDLWDMNEMYKILNMDNHILQAARKALQDGAYEKLLD